MATSDDIVVTLLVENNAAVAGLAAEHGLSWWIEYGPHRVLFDVGQSDAFARHARAMGIDLSVADAIVLSHGHYDHTGGLAVALDLAPRAAVYCHPAALSPKFTRKADGARRSIGLPPLGERHARLLRSRVVVTRTPTMIVEGLQVTGQIPRTNDYEDVGGAFFLDDLCTQPDPLLDDQAIYLNVAGGTVVLLGCAHAGVVNSLAYIQSLTRGRAIRALLGGMHLLNSGELRLAQTVGALRPMDIQQLAPAHCTGADASQLLQREFPDRCRPCHAGDRFTFGPLEASSC